MINQAQGQAEVKNLHIITPNGQILEAVSAWAKIEMVEGFSQVPEPEVSDQEAERLSDEAERLYAEQKAGWC